MLLVVGIAFLGLVAKYASAYNVRYPNDVWPCSDAQKLILEGGLADAKLLAAVGFDIRSSLSDITLTTRLFGNTGTAEMQQVLRYANELAEHTQGVGDVDFDIACPTEQERPQDCSTGDLIWFDNEEDIDRIVMCPSFWDFYSRGFFASRIPEVLNGETRIYCSYSPLTLGLEFLGRLLYHETLHSKYVLDHVEDYRGTDEAYGIGGQTERMGMGPTKESCLNIPTRPKAVNNPDTYSFLTLLIWRRQFCSYPYKTSSDPPEPLAPTTYPVFPACSIGDGPSCLTYPTCPQKQTYAALELIPGRGSTGGPDDTKRIEVLYCALREKEIKCPGRWLLQQFTAYDGSDTRMVSGCFWVLIKGGEKRLGYEKEESALDASEWEDEL